MQDKAKFNCEKEFLLFIQKKHESKSRKKWTKAKKKFEESLKRQVFKK